MKWVVHMDAGTVGTSGEDYFEADTKEEAERIGWDIAVDWAQSYYDVIEEDQEDEYGDPDEHYMVDFIYTSDIGCSVELYDPEIHD
jgi:hypothetical protein